MDSPQAIVKDLLNNRPNPERGLAFIGLT